MTPVGANGMGGGCVEGAMVEVGEGEGRGKGGRGGVVKV